MQIRLPVSLLTFGIIMSVLLTIFTHTTSSAGVNSSDQRLTPAQKSMTLNFKEKKILDQFRARVSRILKLDYMKKEGYLVRFLRQTDFNLEAAEALLRKTLKWRRENKVDTLLDEEFPEFEDDYKIFLEGCNSENVPVISIPMGEWDMLRPALAGQGPRLTRYIYKVYEDASAFLRNANGAGMEVVQSKIIIDLEGFHLTSHGCPTCLSLYVRFLGGLFQYYPGLVERIYLINSPSYVNILRELVRPVISPRLQELTRAYGRDKSIWQKVLIEEIGADQLSRRYGGKKPEALELFYIRLGGQLISTPEQVRALNLTNNCAYDLGVYEKMIWEVAGATKKNKGCEEQ